MAGAIARATGARDFVVEHCGFAVSLPLVLARVRPDVIYFSEWHVGRALVRYRRLTHGRYGLLFNNGASASGPYDGFDHVQQLSPGTLEWVVARGVSPEGQSVLPLGVRIDPELRRPSGTGRDRLRAGLGVPLDRRVVISVAAIDRQKRIDRLIEEVASMPEPRPFLLLVGQHSPETPDLRALADARLGRAGYDMRTVSPGQMPNLLRASDVFVLASLWEGLPRALIEAMAQGLPCVSHAYPTTRYIVGEHGYDRDLNAPGSIARALAEVRPAALEPGAAGARHRHVYERFSWDALRPRYVELLKRSGHRSGPAHRASTRARGGRPRP